MQDQLFSCKWAWCRSTFSENAGLVHHVIHDHVRRAIPVRRRDISVIRRAEEGKGESFKISQLMVDIYSSSSRESISHKSVEPPTQEPSSSLPSPPASSPALHSPRNLARSPPAPSPSPLSLEHMGKQKQRSLNTISRQTSIPLPSSKPLKEKSPPANQITTFASLSSPEPEYSLDVPSSPPFSSLVKGPNKGKMASNLEISRNKTHANQSCYLPLSHPLPASFDSQNSVEALLTQTQDDHDSDQGEDLGVRYHSSNRSLSQALDILVPSFELVHHHNELQWEASQPAEEYLTSNPTFQSQPDDHHHLENLPFTPQPPSQLRLDSEFPLHFHDRPRGSTCKSPHAVHVSLSPLSPSLPIFAVSTPLPQKWYQSSPLLKRKKRSTCNDESLDASPLKAEAASALQTKSKKMFRLGTLRIAPTPLPGGSKTEHPTVDALPMDVDSDANRQNNLATHALSPYDLERTSQDSPDLNSYPELQTQAPYQSQILTQL